MERHALLQAPRSFTSPRPFFSLASSSSSYFSTAVRPTRIGFGAPPSAFGGLRGVRQRSSPALKIHAAKKTYTSFDDMIKNSHLPVLVDFYAAWCGPCQLMAPILKEVGTEMKDQINVVKVDTEKYPQVATRYRVQALPTFVLFVNGKAINVLEGAQPKEELMAHITRTLNAEKANIRQ